MSIDAESKHRLAEAYLAIGNLVRHDADEYEVSLGGSSWVRLSFLGNVLTLDPADREFLFSLVDSLRNYEAAKREAPNCEIAQVPPETIEAAPEPMQAASTKGVDIGWLEGVAPDIAGWASGETPIPEAWPEPNGYGPNCQWCGFPARTHAIKAPDYPHDFEPSTCGYSAYHDHVQGSGAECPECGMRSVYGFGMMLRVRPRPEPNSSNSSNGSRETTEPNRPEIPENSPPRLRDRAWHCPTCGFATKGRGITTHRAQGCAPQEETREATPIPDEQGVVSPVDDSAGDGGTAAGRSAVPVRPIVEEFPAPEESAPTVPAPVVPDPVDPFGPRETCAQCGTVVYASFMAGHLKRRCKAPEEAKAAIG